MWAVLKPGFLAFLEDPLDTEPLDILVFDVLAVSRGKENSDTKGSSQLSLADQTKERNPLYYGFKVKREFAAFFSLWKFGLGATLAGQEIIIPDFLVFTQLCACMLACVNE